MKGLVRGEYHFKWLARTIVTSMLREAAIYNQGLKRKGKEEKQFHLVFFSFFQGYRLASIKLPHLVTCVYYVVPPYCNFHTGNSSLLETVPYEE